MSYQKDIHIGHIEKDILKDRLPLLSFKVHPTAEALDPTTH